MTEVRQLFLLRHADAISGSPSLEDFDRPLSPRGHRQSAYVAARLRTTPIDYVLCSASARTRETVDPILETRGNAMPTVVYDKNVYDGDARTIIEIIAAIPPAAKSVLFVGHNPAIEEVLHILAPTGGSLPGGFPKGACVHLTTTAPWDSLVTQTTKVAGYYRGEGEQNATSAC